MADYRVPLNDMEFVLFNVFKADELWQTLPELAERVDRDTAIAILQECAKIAEQQIAPISRQGDEIGVRFEQGKVITAPGYKEAFKTYAEGGWTALGGDPEYGGMGMPKMLTAMHEEMLCSADISFALYPVLTAGAALALAKHADESLKQTYLTRMYSGEWAASMCLTEAHAGSDLGIIKTKAVPQADGSYQISGSKIFITGGEHDLTDNIVHLVLAKLPDAPAGPKGISLFLVPKFLVKEDGTLGARNQVHCGSIEHKMGIHASSTCVMNFDGATGYLIGEINRGLACMFTMMNFERIGVGIQGIGAAVRSYQNALEYAKERLQGRALTGAKSPEKPADSLLVHGDVRRMLLTMKAVNEGSRALSAYIAMNLDIATYGSGEQQAKGETLAALMTPVAKAFFTDLGFESTVLGQQVFGGHGFIREWGQEQLVRDARITQIYEGTNGIQAMDLLARKVVGSQGKMMQVYLDEVSQWLAEQGHKLDSEILEKIKQSQQNVQQATDYLLQRAKENINDIGVACTYYLHLFGYAAMAYIWGKVLVSLQDNPPQDQKFIEAKKLTAAYFFQHLLPRTESLMATIKAGSDTLFAFDDEQF